MKHRPFTVFALVAACLAAFFVVSAASAQEAKKAKVLLFTRSQGFEHGPVKLLPDGTTLCGNALKKYFADKDIEVVDTQDGGVFDSDLGQYDAFIFYTSGNLQEEKGSKNESAKPMSEAGLKKMIDAVKDGKGFVGIHAATDSHCKLKNEAGEDLYTAFIGARFASHGPMQFASVVVTEPVELPWLKETGKKITNFEEWYAMRNYAKDMHVVLVQPTEGMDGKCYERPDYPSSWVRKEGKGRVAYSAYGHDNRFWQHPENVRKVGEFVLWAVGRFDMDTTPNIEKVTPGANELPK